MRVPEVRGSTIPPSSANHVSKIKKITDLTLRSLSDIFKITSLFCTIHSNLVFQVIKSRRPTSGCTWASWCSQCFIFTLRRSSSLPSQSPVKHQVLGSRAMCSRAICSRAMCSRAMCSRAMCSRVM